MERKIKRAASTMIVAGLILIISAAMAHSSNANEAPSVSISIQE